MTSTNTHIPGRVSKLAGKLWDYHKLNHKLTESDCIMALGSHDLRVAERAVDLYKQGLAPWIVFSGGLGNFTRDNWDKPEADRFADLAIKLGVSPGVIIKENRSTNTGENIRFTKELLKNRGLDFKSFILIQKPYMERRTWATFKKQWPEANIKVSSPQIGFEDYPTDDIPMDMVINIMVGDLQRIKIYPAKGFQVKQDIPDDIENAYNELIKKGYTAHLIS